MLQTIAACKIIQCGPEEIGIFGVVFQIIFHHAPCQCVNGVLHGRYRFLCGKGVFFFLILLLAGC